jgi:hypothetical protein
LLRLDISIHKNTHKEFKKVNLFNLIFDQTAVLPYLVAAILLLYGCEFGLYWIIISFMLSFIKAMGDAWVLLIKINR